MKDTFSSYHPLVNFLYFTVVLVCGMFLLHPACLIISLIGAVSYAIYLNGRRAMRFQLLYLLPLLLITALLNPAFNHQGVTILCYLPSGNPLTLESILYGLAAGVMLVTVISWFSCYHVVMTSDKFIYLFGRIIPALSLILSMSLRFVPRFRDKFRQVQMAQKGISRSAGEGSLKQRMRHAVTIFSIMVTWALESGVETADAMKSRGYGLKGRTAFSIFRWEKRDIGAALAIGLGGIYLLIGGLQGGLDFRYYPMLGGAGVDFYHVTLILVYALLCALPLLLSVWEGLRWNSHL